MSDNAAIREDVENYTDMPVGEILRRTRVYYGQSLEQVEVILRIRAIQLDAIEKGEIERLPGRVYAIGFVRAYSEYLGLDGDKMVHLFKVQSVGGRVKPELAFPAPASDSKVPNLFAIIGGLIGAIFLIALWAATHSSSGGQEPVPEIPVALQGGVITKAPAIGIESSVEKKAELPAGEGAGETAATPTSASGIIITALESSWVEVKNLMGKPILRQVLKPGDQYMVPDEKGLLMATGNAGGLKITVDGTEIPPIGKPAQVKRSILLDREQLLKKAGE